MCSKSFGENVCSYDSVLAQSDKNNPRRFSHTSGWLGVSRIKVSICIVLLHCNEAGIFTHLVCYFNCF